MKYLKTWGFYIFIFCVILAIAAFFSGGPVSGRMTYSELISQVQDRNVSDIILEGDEAIVTLRNPKDAKVANYIVVIPSIDRFMDEMADEIRLGNLNLKGQIPPSPPWWITILPTIGLLLILVLFWVFFFQQNQSGGNRVMSFGKSRAKMAPENRKKVTFSDVAGADEEKEELKEIVDFLKTPKKFVELGARIPKGVLLVGPPGTGKTLLARAVSGEAGVPFFSISGSDFVEMFVGVGASRVRDLFEQAKKNSPCMVFIDEIDAVGRHRGAGLGGGHDEREQTLNQLLVEMDGFGINEGVIILAATNRPDILDPALLRPGRIDRRVIVGYPDIKGREEILKVHARGKPFSPEVKLNEIAKTTPGFTGADLENLLNEAALLAARKNRKQITMEDIKEATFKVIVGPEKKSTVMSEKDKKITAYHEAGHAIAVRSVSTTDKVNRISIIPTGMAGGYTAHRPDEDKAYKTKAQLIETIVIALGGKAAEELVMGEVSTGSSSDLKSANNVARNMVTKYGMSDNLGNLMFSDESNEVFIGRDFGHTRYYSEEMAALIDQEVKRIIDDAYASVKEIIKANMDKMHKIAGVLLEKEKIEAEEFEELYTGSEIIPEIGV